MFENSGPGRRAWAGIHGEQQPKPTQSGRAAVEADAIGEQQSMRTRSGAAADHESGDRAAAEAGAIGEQQLHGGGGKRGSAVEADAALNRAWEQQLKRTQSEKQLFRELSGAGLRTVGEQGGSS